MMREGWLVIAGALSAIAAVAHIGCILGGASWYRFFGAGNRMVRLVERGSPRPTQITLVIAAVLSTWSIYAFSAAAVLPALPLLKPVLITLTAAYLLRGGALPFLFKLWPDRSRAFLIWSSLIVFGIGSIHLFGLIQSWHRL